MSSKLQLRSLAKFTAVSVFLLGGCTWNDCWSDECDSTVEIPPEIRVDQAMKQFSHDTTNETEAVGHVSYDGKQVVFSTQSTGCTLAEHFHVEHKASDGVCLATLVRDRPDMCRRAPFIVNLTLLWKQPEECQALETVFNNPLMDSHERLRDESMGRTLPRN